LTVTISLARDVPVPAGLDEVALRSLVSHALDREGATGKWEINVLFTSDDAIQSMHLEFMGLDSPTDIMTFPNDDGDGFPAGASAGGDIVISVETAREHAEDAGWEELRELQFLVLHGVLHLLGWDDGTTEQRTAMLDRQRVLLDDWIDMAGRRGSG
jgi:probable rRNA maturation factor